MKQLKLKNELLKIESCGECPICEHYQEFCQILITGKNEEGVLPNCPLEDYDESNEKAKQVLDETCKEIEKRFKPIP